MFVKRSGNKDVKTSENNNNTQDKTEQPNIFIRYFVLFMEMKCMEE